MAASRAALIWGLIAEQAVGRGGQVSAVDVSAAAVEALPVSGAWVVTQSAAGVSHVMGVTDEVSEQLAELQLTLGEGPEHDAFTSGSPVLVHAAGPRAQGGGDLRAAAADRGHPGRVARPVPGHTRPAEHP